MPSLAATGRAVGAGVGGPIGGDRARPRPRPWVASTAWPLALVVAALGLALQSLTYLNHDVAWVLYSVGRLLDGGTFGVDVVAANPPLIWWLSALPHGVADVTGWSMTGVFRGFVTILALGSMVLCDRRLVRGVGPGRRTAVLALLAFLFFVGVHRDFGQREHLALILTLPYVLAVAARSRDEPIAPRLAIAIGVAAGIGVAFKPHFVLVPILLEVWLVACRRALRPLVRAEAMAAFATVLVYGLALVAFARPWLATTVPEIGRVYWGFAEPLPQVLRKSLDELLLFAVLAGGAFGLRAAPREAIAATLAAAGFLAAMLLQSKGYTYHLYPGVALTLVGLALLQPRTRPQRFGLGAVVAIALGAGLFTTVGYLHDRSPWGRFGTEARAMAAFVRDRVPEGGHFMAFSTHPYPGFPTTLYAGRDWLPATNSRIFLPAIVRLRESDAAPGDGLLRQAEARERRQARAEIAAGPDLVLVDVRPVRHAIGDSDVDVLDFYLEDPRFRAAWSGYAPVAPAPEGFRAFAPIAGQDR